MNSLKAGSLIFGSLLFLGGATSMDGCAKPGPEAGTAQADEAGTTPAIPAEDLITEAKGVDMSKLSDAQRDSFFQLINSEPSACGKAHSLATSLRDDAECRDSLVVAQLVSDSLASGISVTDLKLGLPEIADALRVREIPIEGRPVYGNERAPVTIVVFADFQCPHCAAEAPVVRKAVQCFRGQGRDSEQGKDEDDGGRRMHRASKRDAGKFQYERNGKVIACRGDSPKLRDRRNNRPKANFRAKTSSCILFGDRNRGP